MKPVMYKVETYFVPEVNKLPTMINEIDHIKIANQPIDESTCESNTQDKENVLPPPRKHYVETATCFVENYCKSSFSAKILEDLMKEEEAVCDNKFGNYNAIQNEENIYRFNNVQKNEFQISIRPQDTMYPASQFKKINKLMSIDEKSERSESSEGKFNDFCYHGYRNGCTATISSPEEVSEEVFKENWLQKIEILRQREAIVMAREVSLQSKERQLFKREKEIRIAERMVKEKLKQLEEQEQQLRQQQDIQNVEKRLEEVGRILRYDERNESHEPLETNELTSAAKLSAPTSVVVPCERIPEKDPEKRPTRNLTRPSSSKSHLSSRQLNSASGVHSYRSTRYKKRPKISYDDLDSTLSADIGDSSYVRTSVLFNPEVYKKPYAFRRSASERWTKHRRYNTIDAKVQDFILPNIEEKPEHAIEEDKILQRLSENICATQDKSTTFQHYGLVDKPDDIGTKVEHNLECRFAHLDLETGNKDLNRRKPVVIASKNRPISWNNQASEWLQKKRQAYNSTIQRSVDKENLQCNTIMQKSGKKDIKTKILTIFR